MRLALHIGWYAIRDVARNRWGLLYTAFFLIVTVGLFQLQAQSAKVAVSLMSICLFLIPLVSSLFGTIYFYNSREFVELVLTQPVNRRTVYVGMFCGLGASLVAGFILGVGLPYLFFMTISQEQLLSLLLLLTVGSFLTIIFLAISFLLATILDDRGKGLAAILGVWLFTALVYDGLVMLATMAFSDYPLETPLLIAVVTNPIDLARVTLLVQTDWAALMGYTGAVFNRFFGTGLGVSIAVVALCLWIVTPLLIGLRQFRHKDL
ncbi:MAG: ABC transporter permease subunit [bacterium]|nr:ABC transporter permease subunit [bacterium]